MSRADEIRLMTRVARMYYVQGIRQQEITERLNIHQSTISRLLKRARETNIVRISVAVPTGIYSELEESLEARFGLTAAIVVDSSESESQEEEHLVRDLGAAAAFFLDSSVKPGTVIGISSWSRALLAMVDALHQSDHGRDGKVVQILGGVGTASSQFHATQLAEDLARRLGAESVLLQAPGVVGSPEARKVLARDATVMKASSLFDSIDLALVGIGSMEPSRLLRSSGNTFSPQEREDLAALGAVGDICLRFFDEQGKLVKSPLMNRVIGVELPTLKKAKRIVGIAGGRRKIPAILGALRGGWINVLITDQHTAAHLLAG